MAVIVDERLAIPLYHGTSDLFYGSINMFGLGGRNLIKEFRVIEFLRQLVDICQTRLPDEEQWILKMQAAEWICQQSVSRGGFNFRHGSTYVTPSSYTAANYATSNEYGSEALSHFMMLWNRIGESRIELPRVITDSARLIIDFAVRPKTPILIRLDGVPANILSAENGRDAGSVFQLIERFSQDKDCFSTICQQSNFELLEPIHISDTDVFRIVEHSWGRVREPLLAPYGSCQ